MGKILVKIQSSAGIWTTHGNKSWAGGNLLQPPVLAFREEDTGSWGNGVTSSHHDRSRSFIFPHPLLLGGNPTHPSRLNSKATPSSFLLTKIVSFASEFLQIPEFSDLKEQQFCVALCCLSWCAVLSFLVLGCFSAEACWCWRREAYIYFRTLLMCVQAGRLFYIEGCLAGGKKRKIRKCAWPHPVIPSFQ